MLSFLSSKSRCWAFGRRLVRCLSSCAAQSQSALPNAEVPIPPASPSLPSPQSSSPSVTLSSFNYESTLRNAEVAEVVNRWAGFCNTLMDTDLSEQVCGVPSVFLGDRKVQIKFEQFLGSPEWGHVCRKWLERDIETESSAVSAAQRFRPLIKLFNLFLNRFYSADLLTFEKVKTISDCREPALMDQYRAARERVRKVYIHTGPTNSGKTHAAMQTLMAAKSGIYCSPLRLLALEKYEEMRERFDTRYNCGPDEIVVAESDAADRNMEDVKNLPSLRLHLRTGQDRESRVYGETVFMDNSQPQSPTHVACTSEMCPLDLNVEVVILDEIQFLFDKVRGGAWLRVLMGARCDTLHICGMTAAPKETQLLLRELLENQCNDVIVMEKEYERLSALCCESEAICKTDPLSVNLGEIEDSSPTLSDVNDDATNLSLDSTFSESDISESQDLDSNSQNLDKSAHLRKLKAGDCVICFSRIEIFRLKRDLERLLNGEDSSESSRSGDKKLKVYVVYGSLPPEVRKAQAKLFNENVERSVLIATDCIGLGLNLNIRRVVFTTMHKHDGKKVRPLTAFEARQIAGRAGRGERTGFVTCFFERDLASLRKMLSQTEEPPPVNEAADLRESQATESKFDKGSLTTCNSTSLSSSTGATENSTDVRACLSPEASQLATFAAEFEKSSTTGPSKKKFSEVLKEFCKYARLSNEHFQLQDVTTLCKLGKLCLDDLDRLTVETKFMFASAPVDLNNFTSIAALRLFAQSYATVGEVPLPKMFDLSAMLPPNESDTVSRSDRSDSSESDLDLPVPTAPLQPRCVEDLRQLEELYDGCGIYLWLAQRLNSNTKAGSPGQESDRAFTDVSKARRTQQVIAAGIREGINTALPISNETKSEEEEDDAYDFSCNAGESS